MSADARKLKTLIAQRSVELTKIKELKKSADQALEDPNFHPNFRCRAKHLEDIYKTFDKIHNNIILLVSAQDNGDIDPHVKIQTEFNDYYFHIEALFTNLFPQTKSELDTTQLQNTTAQCSVKLPKIEVPHFDGEFKHWQTFIDMFDSLIHCNSSLSDISKYNYLVSFLRGPPLALVSSTPLANQNYNIAYQALKNKYDKKRLIAKAHWQALENIKPISNENNHEALRNMIDIYTRNITILNNLGFPTESWSFVLFNMIYDRLPEILQTNFELECGSVLSQDMLYLKSYDTLIEFLEKQCSAKDTISLTKSFSHFNKNSNYDKTKTKYSQKSYKNKPTSSFVVNTQLKQNLTCQVCNKDHFIYNCPDFIAFTPKQRYDLIKSRSWCSNCLGTRHSSKSCNSRSSCRTCGKKHHSLLHFEGQITTPVNVPPSTSSQTLPVLQASSSISEVVSTNLFAKHKNKALLSTALINVQDAWGNFHVIRAVIDSGSESHFISKSCFNKLGLSKFFLPIQLCGIGKNISKGSHGVRCNIKPVGKSDPVYSLEFIILNEISDNLPINSLPVEQFSKFSQLPLADPNFHLSKPVDILLGADIYGFLITGNKLLSDPDQPVALETIFGWIITGRVKTSSVSLSVNSYFLTSYASLDQSLQRFWELEDVPQSSTLSSDEKLAEEHFCKTFSRTLSGHYKVSLPFKTLEPIFEGSRDVALRRFFSLEKRLLRNPQLYSQYSNYMREYLDSQYMIAVQNPSPNAHSYYLPHHCVIRPDSLTTKLRVVFDASARDYTNKSLNDTLLTGPKLQSDILSILLRFRSHLIVFASDIKQMFCQILVNENHTEYLKILWRFNANEPIQEYKLTRVTFGLSCSPFLAIRVIKQIALENLVKYPEASKILDMDTYVDDIISGCDSLSLAIKIQRDLISILKHSGFELRKWTSNSSDFLSQLSPNECKMDSSLSLNINSLSSSKVLGLNWNPSTDEFFFDSPALSLTNKICNKRNILSQLASIFDPCGMLVPLTLHLKLIIQDLWKLGINWDDPAPNNIATSWHQLVQELPCIFSLKVPRYFLTLKYLSLEVHGFCDASEKGYCAVIYFRIILPDNSVKTNFVCAKGKVAPLKKISIPRLELCAALLLTRLIDFVRTSLSNKLINVSTIAWSDSMVVLHWLKSEPYKWNTFVSNRVSQIQEKLPPSCWRHVVSKDNPADPGSRGLQPSELLDNALWWAGPPWLSQPESYWPQSIFTFPETEEEQRKVILTCTSQPSLFDTLFEKFSSFSKIINIVTFCRRFLYNTRHSKSRKTSPLSKFEINETLECIIKCVQSQYYAREILLINNCKSLPKYLRKLTPFIDTNGILRVGGRLRNASLNFSQKHPALLPNNHKFTTLLIEYTHKLYLHPGPQTLHYILAQQYWIVSARKTIRSVLFKCPQCFRANPVMPQPPIMGDIPAVRLSQVKPFSEVGCDYGGPFSLLRYRARGAKSCKAYICLFVCMATKALHLELVSDLSSETFLGALRRFISRRGRCNHIYSDCGTNFVGASRELINMLKSAAEQEQISWHFNPPSAPHFGGLWEAGIKSVKTHIKRVIGDQLLTYEEFYTLLVQIEAVLNSRPLCPQSSDPNDLSVLTPGHFLTLEPLNAPPEDDLSGIKLNHLSRWQLISRLHQSFWSRWSKEYLQTLLQRAKWNDSTIPIEINSVVLIKDDNLIPLKWSIGRVLEIHPGHDRVTRVVTLKTAKGILKRPVTKICPLPYCKSHN